MPGRGYAVDKHPQKEKIIKDLVNQRLYKDIVAEYGGLSTSSLGRYVNAQLIGKIATNTQKKRTKDKDYSTEAFLKRAEKLMVSVQKLYDAYDKWLRDPEHPTRYCIDPRANELSVVFTRTTELPDGKQFTKKYKSDLQSLLDLIKDASKDSNLNLDIVTITNKLQDPRVTFLKTAQVLDQQLKTIATFCGKLEAITASVSIDTTGVLIPSIIQILQEELKDNPALLSNVIQKITAMTYNQIRSTKGVDL